MYISVHYYEQGNVRGSLLEIVAVYSRLFSGQVQLTTTHTLSLALPPAISAASGNPAASKILALIEAEEGKYQMSLTDAYQQMGDKTFKSLRRALPMTRSKLDWEKVRPLRS